MLSLVSHAPAQTEAAGERLAALLCPGDVVALTGGLGAGKTVFVRGLARGLGADCDVSSPTYALIHEYRGGRLRLCHMDAWRLNHPDELEETGFFDYTDAGWAAAVEWSENLCLAADYTVSIERIDDSTRAIAIKGKGL